MKSSFVIIGALAIVCSAIVSDNGMRGFGTLLLWFAGAMFALAVMVMD